MHSQAPGKLLLAGEYAVLTGHTALVAAVDRFVHVGLVDTGEDFHVLCYLGGEPVSTTPLLDACFEVLREESGWKPPLLGLLEVDSTELSEAWTPDGQALKLGLGSSAATAVAVLGALAGAGVEPRTLAHWADLAHRRSQGGVGSGADIAAAAYGGLSRFRRDPSTGQFSVEPLAEDERSGCIGIACWMGRSASTRELVGRVERWRQQDPSGHKECLERIGAAEQDLYAGLRQRDANAVLRAIEAGHQAMIGLDEGSSAGLILEQHRRLARLAARWGGAAKPTGAAGGDLGLAVFPPDSDLRAIQTGLEAEGLPTVELEIVPRGRRDEGAGSESRVGQRRRARAAASDRSGLQQHPGKSDGVTRKSAYLRL